MHSDFTVTKGLKITLRDKKKTKIIERRAIKGR